ncbi:MAG: hypothetical protein V1860_02245 [bacterium]
MRRKKIILAVLFILFFACGMEEKKMDEIARFSICAPPCFCDCADRIITKCCPEAVISIEAVSSSAIVYNVVSITFFNASAAPTNGEILISSSGALFSRCYKGNNVIFKKKAYPLLLYDTHPAIFTLRVSTAENAQEESYVQYCLKEVVLQDLTLQSYTIKLNLCGEKFFVEKKECED